MKWLALLVALGIAFFTGQKYGVKPPALPASPSGIQGEFVHLSEVDLKEYRELKEQKEKYDKANEILGKVMQIFLADLGLRAADGQCQIGAEEAVATAKLENIITTAKTVEPPPAPPAPPAPATPNSQWQPRPSSVGRLDWRFTSESASQAAHALYQAILWRAPEVSGRENASRVIIRDGWNGISRIAEELIRSREFREHVEPNHTSQQIINRMYGVFIGRCAFNEEMRRSLKILQRNGDGRVVTTIIMQARNTAPDQILAGGFSPTSCQEN